MKLVIFGLAYSSSWGNGHATIWRGLCTALARRGHTVVFFERDVPYYAAHRDQTEVPGGALVLYPDWRSVLPTARAQLAGADVAMVTSYCADGVDACRLVLDSKAHRKVFYDLDTPVTLATLSKGERVAYLPDEGLGAFDLVLSYTGGQALEELRTRLGARHVAPLYGSVDPQVHRPVAPAPSYQSALSYLGTFAADRQDALRTLFLAPARRLPEKRFVLGGSQYPADFAWERNVSFLQHVPPPEHPAFYCSSDLTLNVTRGAMAAMGWCPSGRLFEAAACGVPVLSDWWPGLDDFFRPSDEIFLARSTDEALDVLSLPRLELARVGQRARQRTLDEHTARHRAEELERLLSTRR